MALHIYKAAAPQDRVSNIMYPCAMSFDKIIYQLKMEVKFSILI